MLVDKFEKIHTVFLEIDNWFNVIKLVVIDFDAVLQNIVTEYLVCAPL